MSVRLSVRPSTLFSSDLDQTWYVGRRRCLLHNGEFFLTVKVKARSRGFESCQIWPHARSIGYDTGNGCEWRYPYYESFGTISTASEPEFFISSQGLGHVTPNLDYSTKSTKCTIHFLCTTVIFFQIQSQAHGNWEVVKNGLTPDRLSFSIHV